MKRDTRTIAVLLVGLLAISGIVVGANIASDQLFTDTDDIEDDEIVLMPEDTPQGDAYAEIDDGNLSVSITNLTADSTATVDDVFNATYSGEDSEEGSIYFETNNDDVDILNASGDVVNEDNPVNFTEDGQSETFSVQVDDTGNGEVLINEINVVAAAVEGLEDEPPEDATAFNGTVTDAAEEPVTAPEDTLIAAEVDGEEVANTTVDENGVYGDSGFESDIVYEAEEGDEVSFYVRDGDGPVATDSYVIEDDDIGEVVQFDLEFDAGTFDLRVEDLEVDPTEDVSPEDEIDVNATLVNNGSIDLDQDANLTIDGEDADPIQTEDVNLSGGESEEVGFVYQVPEDQSDDFNASIRTDDDEAEAIDVFVEVDVVDTVDFADLDHEFVGIVEDEDDLTVTATDVNDTDDAPITGEVDLSLNTSESTSVELATVDVEDGEIDAEVDPTAVSTDAALGDATLEIGDVQTDATVTLIHEAQNFSTGSTVTSAPLAAQLYTEGDFSTTQWDNDANSYSSDAIDSEGTFTDATNVHRGLFVLTQDPELRFGWEFQEADFDDEESVTITEGWNLVSSNYNISDESPINIEEDLDIDVDSVNVVDANERGTFLETGDDSEEFGAYWVFTNEDRDRTLDNSDYSASDR